MHTTKPYVTAEPNSQQEADALLTVHQQNRLVLLRARALQDLQDTIAFERYLAELGDRE
jgi:hypothetical protein